MPVQRLRQEALLQTGNGNGAPDNAGTGTIGALPRNADHALQPVIGITTTL